MKRLLAAAFISLNPAALIAAPPPPPYGAAPASAPDKASIEAVRKALDSPQVDKQRAALVLIGELGLKEKQAQEMVGRLEDYLKRASNDENQALALTAYGKLSAPSAAAARVIKPYFSSESVRVRRAAAHALVDLVKSTTHDFYSARPVINTQSSVGAVEVLAGGPATVLVMRDWVKGVGSGDPAWNRLDEDAKNLLPLCALAMRDADDQVRIDACEGIRVFAATISENLPDPATSNADTKVIDPLEAKVKWLFFQPVLRSLNANIGPLPKAMFAEGFDARMAATRAAEAVTQARSLALASRRFPPNDLPTLAADVPADDALKTAASSVMPALAARLNDSSLDIQLVAIEGFEHQGVDAEPYLDAILRSSAKPDLFVRWVSSRTLGGLFAGAGEAGADKIVKALIPRALDTDLDVQNAALNAIGRGGKAATAATGTVLSLTLHGDPDLRVLACKTLALIDADPKITVPVIAGILDSSETDVRKAAAVYLGTLGPDARPALPRLRPLLLDSNEDVRREAAQALLKIE